jgi:hypothetical protein
MDADADDALPVRDVRFTAGRQLDDREPGAAEPGQGGEERVGRLGQGRGPPQAVVSWPAAWASSAFSTRRSSLPVSL